MKFLFSICISLLVLTSCRSNRVSVRLKNTSKVDFEKITVQLGDSVRTFYNLPKGQRTKPFIVNSTYGYGFTNIIYTRYDQTKDTVTLWPVDYVGEKFYKRGRILMKVDLYVPKKSKNVYIDIRSRRRKF